MADARLVNNSDDRIEFGMIQCDLRTDRQTASGWTEIPHESGVCPLVSFGLESRRRYWFRFAAPTESGTFRLRTVIRGEPVSSAPFTVR